jgi:hypothetical protein
MYRGDHTSVTRRPLSLSFERLKFASRRFDPIAYNSLLISYFIIRRVESPRSQLGLFNVSSTTKSPHHGDSIVSRILFPPSLPPSLPSPPLPSPSISLQRLPRVVPRRSSLDSDDNKCKIIHGEARRIQSAIQSEMVIAEVINTYHGVAEGQRTKMADSRNY